MLRSRDVTTGLLPRLPRGHENDLVEVEEALNLTRRDEVTVVNGVERTAHDPDSWCQCEAPCFLWLSGAGPPW